MKSQYELARDEKADAYTSNIGAEFDKFFTTLCYIRGADWARDFELKRAEKLVRALEQASAVLSGSNSITPTTDALLKDRVDEALKEYEDAT